MSIPLPPPGDFAGYIFDCDGTLAATMHLHYRAWKQAFAHHGAKFDFTWEMFISHAGRGTSHFVTLINELFRENLDPAQVAHIQDQFLAEIHHTVQPVPEVVALARKLAVQGKPLAVASGGTRAAVGRTLEYIGLRGLFPVVVTIEDVIHGKPAPEMFLVAARRLNVLPQQCLVLGDSVLDIEGAKAAGMAWVKLDPK